ncbi:MAG: HAD-IB family hydrolase [SAR86 cluster bacterium]|uniref:HAD-IB family hydrolase n=1 Tax=SAR86 cluster bacterium TaxID=2030880 RepID=A0A2A4X5F8_9GAMM|nr:MAG: HAD-IB family hydrolase [SAR86 cluster bacterium]
MQSISSRKLALFDLDNTLLEGDSDHAWGEFLISNNLVEEEAHREKNDHFYDQYKQGALDIHGYVAFTLEPVIPLDSTQRAKLLAEFMQQSVEPIILDKGRELVRTHLEAGDFCIIITATNEFISAPIAKLFDVDLLIATELQTSDDRYNGKISGTPCYQDGKVSKLNAWINQQENRFNLSDAVFYSDSINDLPLLQEVATPVAVDPDQKLRDKAKSEGWKILTLRN